MSKRGSALKIFTHSSTHRPFQTLGRDILQEALYRCQPQGEIF